MSKDLFGSDCDPIPGSLCNDDGFEGYIPMENCLRVAAAEIAMKGIEVEMLDEFESDFRVYAKKDETEEDYASSEDEQQPEPQNEVMNGNLLHDRDLSLTENDLTFILKNLDI